MEIYNIVKKLVPDVDKLKIIEYFPLFQFSGYSIIIKYNDIDIVRITSSDGYCVPQITTTKKINYGSFQYLLMRFLIDKFKYHIDQNKDMYFNSNIAFSNLIDTRNYFLENNNLPVINNTIFSDFRVDCLGSTLDFRRECKIRNREKFSKGIKQFKYSPVDYFSDEKIAEKIDNAKKYISFKNTSGNEIYLEKSRLFTLNNENDIIENEMTIDNNPDITPCEEAKQKEKIEKSE